MVNGARVDALVDSGCTRCIVDERMCQDWTKCYVGLVGISGCEVPCRGEGFVDISHGESKVRVRAIVVDRCPLDSYWVHSGNEWY